MRYGAHEVDGAPALDQVGHDGRSQQYLHRRNITPLATRDGFSGPEAVRYDADQDVYFVGNFNGSGSALDNNGFISRVRPNGKIEVVALSGVKFSKVELPNAPNANFRQLRKQVSIFPSSLPTQPAPST